jgi:hypothetical protein
MWAETHKIEISKLAFAPDNLSLAIGMYNTYSGERMPVYDESRQYQGEMILFEYGHLVRPPSEIPNVINAKFGEGIILQGYGMDDVFVLRGQKLNVTLHWYARRALNLDYTVSIQLIDSNWNKAGQNDNWPMNGNTPTSTWVKGDTYIEERSINIAPESTPGVYDLRIALYRIDETGILEHLPVVWHQGQMPASSVTLTRVRVD